MKPWNASYSSVVVGRPRPLGHLTIFLQIFTIFFFNFGKFDKIREFFCRGNEFSIYGYERMMADMTWNIEWTLLLASRSLIHSPEGASVSGHSSAVPNTGVAQVLECCEISFWARVLQIGKRNFSFLPCCMECRRGLAMRILSVRPSVHSSNAWFVTKSKKDRSRLLYHTKEHLA